MFSYRRLSENMGEGDEDWVDFPASPKPDRWGALLREANRLLSGKKAAKPHQPLAAKAASDTYLPRHRMPPDWHVERCLHPIPL